MQALFFATNIIFAKFRHGRWRKGSRGTFFGCRLIIMWHSYVAHAQVSTVFLRSCQFRDVAGVVERSTGGNKIRISN